MSHDIFYYNFAWKDYGEAASMSGLLDMVKVSVPQTGVCEICEPRSIYVPDHLTKFQLLLICVPIPGTCFCAD